MHAYGDAGDKLSDRSLDALRRFRDALCSERPRVLNARPANAVFCFTDACLLRAWLLG